MKILYDYPSFSQTHGGVSRYVCQIISELHSKIDIDLSIFVTDNLYLEELPFLKSRHLFTSKRFKGKQRLERMINTIYSNYKIMQNDYDIFHATYSDSYYLRKRNKPVVVTIHDMINEKIPEYRQSHAKHIASKKKLIYDSKHIIAISENTKKDILDIYPVNPDKITVIYHGAPTPIAPIPIKNIYGKYLLFVGRRTRYKNFPFFAESIASLLKERNINLVCVGPRFTSEEEIFLSQLGIRERTSAVNVDDAHLYSLYKNALGFIFPSKFEGFGIPILEAFASECPVCLSNASCFPEIAGNAALYFDPFDSNSIYNNVNRLITDRELSKELVRSGLKRLTLFSWKDAADQTLSVYKSI